MIKAIIFDFWGTLVENGVWSPTKQVKNILQIREPFSEYVVRMERAMMTRQFENLREAFEAVGKEFNVSCSPEQLDELIGMWNKSWMLAKLYEDTEEALQKLAEKYKLLLFSNTDCFSLLKVFEKYQLGKYFEKIYLSYELGVLKTDQEFLRRILEENELAAEDLVVIGDSIESDMAAAERLGLKSILLDRKGTRPFPAKIKTLSELPSFLS